MPIFVPLICLMAMGLAVFRRSVPDPLTGSAGHDDVPAAASARLRPHLAVSVASAPFTAPGHLAGGDRGPEEMRPYEAGRGDRGRSWRRTVYLLLLCAVVAAAVFGVALGLLRG